MDFDAAQEFFEDAFVSLDLSGASVVDKEFESCSFLRCRFERAILARCRFLDCTFEECDLSSVKVVDTAFRDVRFRESKLIGIDWTQANLHMGFQISLQECRLDFSVFSEMDLAHVGMKSCRGENIALDGTTLKGIQLADVDFGGSTLARADLRQADLSGASNLAIDLMSCRLGKTKISIDSAYDSLERLGVKIA